MPTKTYSVSIVDPEIANFNELEGSILTEYDLEKETKLHGLKLREVTPTPFVDVYGHEDSTFRDKVPVRYWFRAFEILDKEKVVGIAVSYGEKSSGKIRVELQVPEYVINAFLDKYPVLDTFFHL